MNEIKTILDDLEKAVIKNFSWYLKDVKSCWDKMPKTSCPDETHIKEIMQEIKSIRISLSGIGR